MQLRWAHHPQLLLGGAGVGAGEGKCRRDIFVTGTKMVGRYTATGTGFGRVQIPGPVPVPVAVPAAKPAGIPVPVQYTSGRLEMIAKK